MKKKLRFLLLALLLFTLLALTGVPAAADVAYDPIRLELTADSWQGADPASATLTVHIRIPANVAEGDNNNPGLSGYTICLNYDPAQLTPISGEGLVQVGSVLDGETKCNATKSGKIIIVLAAVEHSCETGELLSVTFTKAAASAGGVETTVSLNSGASEFSDVYYDEDLEKWIRPARELSNNSVLSVSVTPPLSDHFSWEKDPSSTLTLADGLVSGSATAKISSYGSKYSGAAIAMLGCYAADGRMVGVLRQNITVAANNVTNVTFADLSFAVNTSAATVKLFLLYPADSEDAYADYAPMCAALSYELGVSQ